MTRDPNAAHITAPAGFRGRLILRQDHWFPEYWEEGYSDHWRSAGDPIHSCLPAREIIDTGVARVAQAVKEHKR